MDNKNNLPQLILYTWVDYLMILSPRVQIPIRLKCSVASGGFAYHFPIHTNSRAAMGRLVTEHNNSAGNWSLPFRTKWRGTAGEVLPPGGLFSKSKDPSES